MHSGVFGGQECGMGDVGQVVRAVARGNKDVERTALCSGYGVKTAMPDLKEERNVVWRCCVMSSAREARPAACELKIVVAMGL